MPHPPLYVRAVGSLNCIVLGTFGLRNIFAPGKALPFVPRDDAFQRYVWAGLEAADLSPGQVRTMGTHKRIPLFLLRKE